MKIVMFYHSLVSDWNHGNAHFLRGVATEFIKMGHNIRVLEPENSWSRTNLLNDHGNRTEEEFKKYYPRLNPIFYNDENPDIDSYLHDADIVLVHEWNSHQLISDLGKKKAKYNYKLFFHDTHHRAVTDPENMKLYDLSEYDGVIAFGEVIKQIYIKNKWTKQAWSVHEAADTNIFYPRPAGEFSGDLVWIGNWGDEERSYEIREFLITPVKELKLKCKIYGVRYPSEALKELEAAGIEYGGWLPNYKVPEVFSRYKFTLHIPRRPYVEALPGIPTIRPFEAMACGIPLISAPWKDSEGLFSPGMDYLTAADSDEMKSRMLQLLNSEDLRIKISSHAQNTIRERHTCRHRAEEFNRIFSESYKELTVNGI
jgi:spore maturation protein CgeB